MFDLTIELVDTGSLDILDYLRQQPAYREWLLETWQEIASRDGWLTPIGMEPWRRPRSLQTAGRPWSLKRPGTLWPWVSGGRNHCSSLFDRMVRRQYRRLFFGEKSKVAEIGADMRPDQWLFRNIF